LLGEYDIPEAVCTDKLASYRAAIRELPTLDHIDYQQVISTAHCNTLIEQSHRSTRRQERSQLGFRQVRRAQGYLNLHARTISLHGPALSTQGHRKVSPEWDLVQWVLEIRIPKLRFHRPVPLRSFCPDQKLSLIFAHFSTLRWS
jgi:hypothetical protein